jgi:tetratricopeptide (TPR) repeat protein
MWPIPLPKGGLRKGHSHRSFRSEGEGVTQDPHAIDSYANGLLTIAIKDLKEGRILSAHIISKGLGKVSFFRKGEARVIEATASMHMHPSSVYEGSASKYQSVIDDQDLQDATIPRGAAYLGLAWAKIGLEDYSAAGWAAEEAAKVFTKIGANPELGDAIYIQGLLEVSNGNLENALTMFKRSSTFNAMNPTRALRVSHDGFEDSLERLFESESFDSEFRTLIGATA